MRLVIGTPPESLSYSHLNSMLVLQDCSICYAEFDDGGMKPHTISCGHIFCNPCLKEISSIRKKCPICRRMFDYFDIRPIHGMESYSELDSKPKNEPKDEEKLLWESLEEMANADPKGRKVLALNHTDNVPRGSGMSKRLEIALGLLRSLLSTEEDIFELRGMAKTAIDKAVILDQRISLLEDELKAVKGTPHPNLEICSTSKLTPEPTGRDPENKSPVASTSASAQMVKVPGTATPGSCRVHGSLAAKPPRIPKSNLNGYGRGGRTPNELNSSGVREGNRLQSDRRGLQQGSRGNSARAETTVTATTGRRACIACINRTTSQRTNARFTTS